MLSINNRFLPIQEGWFNYYSLLMTKYGKLPYKDFYFYLQPLPLMIVQLITKFSDHFILLRYYGIIERCVLIIALYYLLSRVFSPAGTFLGVVAATAIYQSISVDLFYTFYQTTLLFFVFALIFLQKSYRSKDGVIYILGVGLFASFAFFTKQSNGFFCVAFIFLLIMFWSESIKRALLSLGTFILGFSIPAVTMLGWLMKNNILKEYIQQVFFGSSSKGTIFSILFGFFGRVEIKVFFPIFVLLTIIIMVFIKFGIIKIKINQEPIRVDDQKYYLIYFWFIPLSFLISFFVSYLFRGGQDNLFNTGSIFISLLTFLIFYILLGGSLIIGINWFRKKDPPFPKPIAMLMLAGLTWMYSSALSFQIDQSSVMIGGSILVAYFIDNIKFDSKIPKEIFISILCCLVFISAYVRLEIPYRWWGWEEAKHQENTESIVPAFKGFLLSSNDVKIYDRIYTDILTNTKSDDYVFTYPFLTMFNFITDRLQPTFAPVHYFDVCPDSVAISDANILRQTPPKMIVFLSMPESVYLFHEQAFRNGNKSGQREIEKAVRDIVEQYHYQVLDRFITPLDHWILTVYLKP